MGILATTSTPPACATPARKAAGKLTPRWSEATPGGSVVIVGFAPRMGAWPHEQWRTDGPIHLHSWTFLSAAARERLAGVRGIAGFSVSIPRLERTHHG